MAIPLYPKRILPSLQIAADGKAAVLHLSDLKALFPSLGIVIGGKDAPLVGTVRMSIEDFRKVLRVVLGGVTIEEEWYYSQVPGLRKDIKAGKFKSVAEHYYIHGYLEGKLPERPRVDEMFYLRNNRDVEVAVSTGVYKSGFEHFVKDGYKEGRAPNAEGDRNGSSESDD